MGRQHGRQLGTNIVARDTALASIRSQAISKALTVAGTFAAKLNGMSLGTTALRHR
jgi:hypothetical protein